MTSIKFWYAPGACSLAPHIVLKEAGIEFESIRLDAFAGYPEEFRRINPKMRVPVLAIDGEAITEVPAIMTAISQLAPERHLLGETNLEIVRAYEWMNWLSGVVHGQAFGGLFRPARYSDDATTHPSIEAKALLTIQECFAAIDEKLASQPAIDSRFTAYCCEHNIYLHRSDVQVGGCGGCGVYVGGLLRAMILEDFPCDLCQKYMFWVPWNGMWYERSLAELDGWRYIDVMDVS
ncbi:hypothetical protein PWT90_07681 [Aphanocladium album]|nr:hypothetical protein PWT90_07681 [Aphanocladium album]